MAIAPYKNLPAEIESLKCVLELKNQEIRELRKCKMELEKQVSFIQNMKCNIFSFKMVIIITFYQVQTYN